LPSCPGTSSLRTVGRRPRWWLHLHWCFDDGSRTAFRFLTRAPESTPLVNGSPRARAGGFSSGCMRLFRWQVRRWLWGKRTSARFPKINRLSEGSEQYKTICPTSLDRTCHQLRTCFADAREYRFFEDIRLHYSLYVA
jgi:hypothetical protein